MSNQGKVAVLKQQLEHLFPGKWLSSDRSKRSLLTGIAEIDQGLAGGLAKRRVTEWNGSISSGKTTLLRMAVANWCAQGLSVAYVDPSGRLSPSDWAFVEKGNYAIKPPYVVPSAGGRFWVIRDVATGKRDEPEVVWAVEQLTLSNIFDVVILDAGGMKFTSRTYARLLRVLDRSKVALIVLRDEDSVVTSHWGAHTRLSFSWSKPVHCQYGLTGVAALMPTIKGAVMRDGISHVTEVAVKAHVSNSLFTHPLIPDRRTAKV